jgi:hypothetical protein
VRSSWQWVFHRAIPHVLRVPASRHLLSRSRCGLSFLPRSSLLRLEVLRLHSHLLPSPPPHGEQPAASDPEREDGVVSSVVCGYWGTSDALSALRNKDLLVGTLESVQCVWAAPPSLLLPWPQEVSGDYETHFASLSLPPPPPYPLPLFACPLTSTSHRSFFTDRYVLKPPMGCQGEGIEFLSSPQKCVPFLRADEQLARDTHAVECVGRLPHYVLQAHIASLLLSGRKCHLRSHLLLIEPPLLYSLPSQSSSSSSSSSSPSLSPVRLPSSSLRVYFHTEHEVRIAAHPMATSITSSPTANSSQGDGDEGDEYGSFADRQAHITNGAGGADTQRILLDDVAELSGLSPLLDQWICEFVSAVYPSLLREANEKEAASVCADRSDTLNMLPFCLTKFAFSALDLMIDESGRVWLLEVNASPGVAAMDHVDDRFQDHLVRMGRDVCDVLLNGSSPRFKEVSLPT